MKLYAFQKTAQARILKSLGMQCIQRSHQENINGRNQQYTMGRLLPRDHEDFRKIKSEMKIKTIKSLGQYYNVFNKRRRSNSHLNSSIPILSLKKPNPNIIRSHNKNIRSKCLNSFLLKKSSYFSPNTKIKKKKSVKKGSVLRTIRKRLFTVKKTSVEPLKTRSV